MKKPTTDFVEKCKCKLATVLFVRNYRETEACSQEPLILLFLVFFLVEKCTISSFVSSCHVFFFLGKKLV